MQVIQDTLTSSSVSIQSDEYGTRAYINNAQGRTRLAAECPPNIVQQIFEVWGDTPTVDEPVIDYPEPTQDGIPIDQRVAAVEDAITELMFGGAV